MPFVEIKMLAGATRAQKAALVDDVTRSLVERVGKRPDTIHIVITEVARENWGVGGRLTDESVAADLPLDRPGEDADAESAQ